MRFMKLLGVCLLVLGSFHLHAQTERNTIFLKDLDWFIGNDSENKNAITWNIDELGLININAVLKTTISNDHAFQFALLTIPNPDLFEVVVNEQSLEQEESDVSFDITDQLYEGNVDVILKLTKEISAKQLAHFSEYAQLNLISGLGITSVIKREDLFFGGSLVEIKVRNQYDKDIDGKLVVRLINPDNWEDIAENNNCAFSRSNSDIAIEVNFPVLETDLKGQDVLVNVSLVDKENGERVVDEVLFPMVF